MPKKDTFTENYPDRLLYECGIKIIGEFKGAKQHHLLECDQCGYQWNATPISKLQNIKKYPQAKYCPKCNMDRRHKDVRHDVLTLLQTNNIQVLDDSYNGQRMKTTEKIRVKNTVCGHTFDLCIANWLNENIRTNCIICGIEQRSKMLTQTSIDRHIEWMKTANEWQLFKYEVEKLTKKTYREFKDLINPQNLQRGMTGVDGNYHLDHIISRRYCFENNIPANICSHQDNLRMIPWAENVSKGKHIVTDIPLIFDNFIESSSIVDWEDTDTIEEMEIFAEIE